MSKRENPATTIRLDGEIINTVDGFVSDYLRENKNMEITFAQAARYLIRAGAEKSSPISSPHRAEYRIAGFFHLTRSGVDHTVAITWLAMASNADALGFCSIRKEELAESIGRTRSTTIKSINKLIEIGAIELATRGGGCGKVSRYRLRELFTADALTPAPDQ